MPHRFRTTVRRLLPAVSLVLAPLLVHARVAQTPQTALPNGQELVRRHVAAIGGEAAFKAVRSMRVRGRFEMSGQNISADFEQLAARPNKLLMRADIAGVGHTEQGFDGAVAWTIDPQSGPRLLIDRERDETIADAIFDAPLHLPEHVKEITTVGRETFEGRPAYRAKVVLQSGVEQDEFFDVDTGLEIGWTARRATPLGVVPTTAVLRDYKKFGALMQPTTLVQRALFVQQVLRVTSVEYDVVPSSTFDLPPSIKALVK
jgi:hypothetical protein